MNDTLKADFLKRVDAWPTDTVTVRGVELTIQSLNRDQAMLVGAISNMGEREATMISMAVIEPFTLTVEEAQSLRVASEPMDLEPFTEAIAKLSGMDKRAKEAQNAAFKSVRDGSGTGV